MDQQEQQEQEIEINFKLDNEGRTVRTAPNASATETSNEDDPPGICYESRSIKTELWWSQSRSGDQKQKVESTSEIIDEIQYDCEIADCGLMPRTFWIGANGVARCSLEQMALNVFQHHAGNATHLYDPETSGAEYWVQIRPSPEKTGRYSMHDKSSSKDDMAKEGISFHWDKDEDLRILCGGNTYVHPHISTVTYLTDIGAPTLALNYRVHNLTGEYITPESNPRGFVSWPKFGKHLSFDGRYLHAAPANLMEEGAFQKQCQLPKSAGQQSASAQKKLERRHRRVTFLVNVWLNFKPFGINLFPDTMISKLSGHKADEARIHINFVGGDAESDGTKTERTTVGANGAKEENKSLQRFRWPMGDCTSDEYIEADVPLGLIRRQAVTGGSLDITWEGPGVRLCRYGDDGKAGETKSNDEKEAKRQKLEES